jgi:hypothetical protein
VSSVHRFFFPLFFHENSATIEDFLALPFYGDGIAMVVGHYATAFLPYGKHPEIPLWVFLLCANLTDFLWLFVAFWGYEVPTPPSFWEGSFYNIEVEMPYTHELPGTLVLTLITGLLAYFFYRNFSVAFWCAGLVFLHFLCDLLSGFQHYCCGTNSFILSLSLYEKAPFLAVALEALFGACCLIYFEATLKKQGKALSRPKKISLYLLVVGGALIWLPSALIPLGSLLGFTPFRY